MLIKILNVEGVETLSKEKQKKVRGGRPRCSSWICSHQEYLVLQPACECDA